MFDNVQHTSDFTADFLLFTKSLNKASKTPAYNTILVY